MREHAVAPAPVDAGEIFPNDQRGLNAQFFGEIIAEPPDNHPVDAGPLLVLDNEPEALL